MNTRTLPRSISRLVSTLTCALLCTLPLAAYGFAQDKTATKQTPPPTTTIKVSASRTPSDVLRDFYKAMRERRFREAFAMSIYKPAVEGLSAAEFEELRPDFEEMASEFPERVDIGGEQISGEVATVFVKVVEDGADKLKPTELIRAGDEWIIGGRSDQAVVNQQGKRFFFEARIEQHHSLVEDLMKRIAAAQLLHSAQNNGQFADLSTLIRGGHVPQDVLTPALTGYNIHVAPQKNGKDYTAGAEPVRYAHTGRLSYYLDSHGLKSKDTGGKPLKK